jgi:drug/metabolite transporter (DMT)-like permease
MVLSTTTLASTGLVASNIGAALQPAVIKSVQLTEYVQTVIRIIVFAIGSILWGLWKRGGNPWISTILDGDHIALSLMNLLSIYSGIRGFELLPVGVGLTTFYTWPIWLTYISQKNQKFSHDNQERLWWGLGISFVGLIILYLPHWANWIKGRPEWSFMWWGFFWILISSITHAISIWYMRRKDTRRQTAESRLGVLSVLPAILLTLLMFFSPQLSLRAGYRGDGGDNGFRWEIFLLVLFQATIGLGSFLTHFWSVAYLPAEWISGLGFITLLAGYFFGWIFFGEPLSFRVLFATTLIIIGIALVSRAVRDIMQDNGNDEKNTPIRKVKEWIHQQYEDWRADDI